MKDVLFESSMPKYWRISTTTGERTAGGDYDYATVWVPYSSASDARLTANIENADILLTQCPEKRRKQAYIYAKIRTGSVQNCLPESLINHQVNISDLTM